MSRRTLATAAVVVAAAACGASPSDSDDRRGGQLVDGAAAAVGVLADGCALATGVGSGVVVESDGQVVTVAHTVRGARDVRVVAADGSEHVATVSAFDPDADLAVLDVPTLDVSPLRLATGPVRLGDATVYAWSSDDGVRPIPVEVARRLVISIEDIFVEDDVMRTGMELSGDIEIGVSGSAVVDADGSVVGIVYARSRGRDAVGFATDAAEVRDLLDDRPLDSADRCHS